MIKKITLLLCVLLTTNLFSQLNVKIIVESIKVIDNVSCDVADDSDFLFEFKATDNSPFAYSNNSPVAGSIGQCNYALVNGDNGPFYYMPSVSGPAVFNPSNGVFFDRNYSCKKDVPSIITINWTAYENDDIVAPSIIPNANGTVAISSNTVGIQMTNPTAQSYQYTLTSSDGGCPQKYEITFGVLLSYGTYFPLFNDHVHESVICTGASNGLVEGHPMGGFGAYSYDWSSDGLGDYDDPLILSGLPQGTYTFVVKDALNCTDTMVANVTSVDPPTNLIGFSTSTSSVCTGTNTIFYSVNGPANVDYFWNYSGTGVTTFSSSNTYSINYLSGSTSGTVSVYAKNDCASTQTLTIDVNVIPTPTITVTGNSVMCDNSQEVLSVSGATDFIWSTSATTSSIVVNPTVTTVYSVTGTTNGCSTSKQFSMTVLPSPTVQISSSSSSVCPSQTVTLTASGNGNVFIWSDGFIGANHIVSSNAAVVYTVTNTYTNSCYSQDTYSLYTIPVPSISVTGNTLACSGIPVILSVSGADSYLWDNGATTSTLSYVPTGLNTLTVTGTSTLTGCKGVKLVDVNNFSLGSVSINGSTVVCAYAEQVYTASGANFYLWNNGESTNVNTITPINNTTLSVVGTTINGCKDSTSLTITVIDAYLQSVTGVDTICNGQSAVIAANSIGATTYSWSSGQTSSVINVSPVTTTIYEVTTQNGICTDTKSHEIVVKSSPSIIFNITEELCVNNPALVLNATPAGGIYVGTGIFGNTFDPSVGIGTYPVTYQITGSNNCSSSSTQSIVVSACVGVNEHEKIINISAYPNPTTSFIEIKSQVYINAVSIYDFTGKFVKQIMFNKTLNHSVSLDELPVGIYTLVVQSDNSVSKAFKIIKE